MSGDKEIRTLDLLRAKQMLSQLSYIPKRRHTLTGVPAGLIFEAGKCQEGRCLYRVSLAIQLSTAFRL